MMLYQLHEFWRSGLKPFTYWADAGSKMYSASDSWLSGLPGAERTAAGFELMYRLGKEYEKPEFGIHTVAIDGMECPVVERVDVVKPFCRLVRFKRFSDDQEVLRNDVESVKRTIVQVAGDDREQTVLLRADARTPYQAVVTVQDALGQLGFRRIAIATAPVVRQ